MKNIRSLSINDTFSCGFQLGACAKPGAVYTLSGPLGAGKTVFAQGFAAGLGCDERITSPTFTIVNVHETGRLPLYHFDLYRLDAEGLESTGYEEYIYGRGVCLIEWPERADGLLHEDAVHIEIRLCDDNEMYREITIHENPCD